MSRLEGRSQTPCGLPNFTEVARLPKRLTLAQTLTKSLILEANRELPEPLPEPDTRTNAKKEKEKKENNHRFTKIYTPQLPQIYSRNTSRKIREQHCDDIAMTFLRFPELPFELQDRIWELAIPEPTPMARFAVLLPSHGEGQTSLDLLGLCGPDIGCLQRGALDTTALMQATHRSRTLSLSRRPSEPFLLASYQSGKEPDSYQEVWTGFGLTHPADPFKSIHSGSPELYYDTITDSSSDLVILVKGWDKIQKGWYYPGSFRDLRTPRASSVRDEASKPLRHLAIIWSPHIIDTPRPGAARHGPAMDVGRLHEDIPDLLSNYKFRQLHTLYLLVDGNAIVKSGLRNPTSLPRGYLDFQFKSEAPLPGPWRCGRREYFEVPPEQLKLPFLMANSLYWIMYAISEAARNGKLGAGGIGFPVRDDGERFRIGILYWRWVSER